MSDKDQLLREIDIAIVSAGVRKYEVAGKIGSHEAVFSRYLRRHMSPELKEKIIKAIDEIKAERFEVNQR